MVRIGSQANRELEDYYLSRFACYLIAQNGDPRKPEIAQAQKYFAIQTRRQEISDRMAADLERIEIRQQAKVEFKALSGATRKVFSQLPVRQLTGSMVSHHPFHFSQLPVRQLTISVKTRPPAMVSQLPVRQLTMKSNEDFCASVFSAACAAVN